MPGIVNCISKSAAGCGISQMTENDDIYSNRSFCLSFFLFLMESTSRSPTQ